MRKYKLIIALFFIVSIKSWGQKYEYYYADKVVVERNYYNRTPKDVFEGSLEWLENGYYANNIKIDYWSSGRQLRGIINVMNYTTTTGSTGLIKARFYIEASDGKKPYFELTPLPYLDKRRRPKQDIEEVNKKIKKILINYEVFIQLFVSN